jgi:hypothetical protein
VIRTTCSGRCAVPTNKSVDSTLTIRICSSLHASGLELDRGSLEPDG